MTRRKPCFVDNSISPVVSHVDDGPSRALSEQKELVEKEVKTDEQEVAPPVPDLAHPGSHHSRGLL